MASLFPFHDYWWFYLVFSGFVLLLLLLDLGIFHRKSHAIGFKEASAWSAVWVVLALFFCWGLYEYGQWRGLGDATARTISLEFLAGYVIEKSLSVDNLFVFVLIFQYFAVPPKYQHRVLFYGILGALVFRAIFIALGAALLRYEWVIWLFGGFLIVTGVRMLYGGEPDVDPERNFIVRMLRRRFRVTPQFHGHSFFTRLDGVVYATPLLLTLGTIEFTDIVFAVDSVPAVFAVTKEPLLVFTSNIFAILGLRAMYFMLAHAFGKFHLLRYGLGLILVFVGLKMAVLNHLWGGKFPIGISLSIIGVLLAASIVLSLVFPKKEVPAPLS
jgi:tellurite resistance protein TerC